jgi:hypothetical protein
MSRRRFLTRDFVVEFLFAFAWTGFSISRPIEHRQKDNREAGLNLTG